MSSTNTGSLQDRILALYGVRNWPFSGSKKAASRPPKAAGNSPRSPAEALPLLTRVFGGSGLGKKATGAMAAILAIFIAVPFVWDSLESANGPDWFFSQPEFASTHVPVSGMRATGTLAAKRWAAKDFSGDVRVQTKNGIWRPMTKQHGIAAGTRIETGKTGRIVLRQKSDVVTVTPNTQLTIPKKGKNNVLLTFGRVLFDMERRPDRRFSVGTSHLVAVVKGTRFAVEADNEASTVQLTKGAVQVTAFKADRTLGDTHLMEPGQIVVASKGGNGKLTIINKKSWKAQ